MIIAKKYEVPDSCPGKCPGQKELFHQGGLCHYCPIFQCGKIEAPPEYADKEGFFCLCEADDYRLDWAKTWSEWFKGDMKEYPVLPLHISTYKKGAKK